MDSKLCAHHNTNDNNKSIDLEIVVDDAQKMSKNDHNNKMVIKGIYENFVSITLVKFHAGYFRISLALCSQVMLWKTLVQFTRDNHADLQLHPMLLKLPTTASTLLWSVALVVLIALSLVYALKILHHFDKVKEEFLHHVGVNYLFAPWISCLLLLQSSPILIVPNGSVYQQLTWWTLVVPIIMLDIKLYGQWFIKGKRVLTKVANPACQLSVIANLVASKAAIFMGWYEISLCFFALGVAHYLVLFVTLYQRHPGSNGVTPKLRPVFFLFVATPSMASLAWSSIAGTFDVTSKLFFFLSIFLFMSLACRPTLFKKSMRKFSVAWWSFSFPMTSLALASVQYAKEVQDYGAGAPQAMALVLSCLSIMVSLSLMVFTTLRINGSFLAPTNTTTSTPKHDKPHITTHT